jgi:flagellar FlgN protein
VSAVLSQLEQQVACTRRLLGIVLAQGEAIRRQDVEAVLARLADVQAEMVSRHGLELERDALIAETAHHLGLSGEDITFEHLLLGLDATSAAGARALSAELQGLVLETSRVHQQNQILIRQELAFLSHLMSLMSGSPQAGYLPGGWAPAQQPGHAVDARA